MESLTITILNSREFNASKLPIIDDLLMRSDIVLQQEHLLSDSQLPMLSNLNSGFEAIAISRFDCNHALQGMPFRGCAVFLRKSIDLHFERIVLCYRKTFSKPNGRLMQSCISQNRQ